MRRRILSLFLSVLCLASTLAGISFAAPSSRGFGPVIEGTSGYEGQSKCSPSAKPGVVAFQRMVLEAYPGTGVGGIGRACNVGGQSEHKEGRAWDWSVNVGVPHQKAAAESLIKWLLAEDRFGNDAAMARRVGLMYMIWNRRIWFPWGGWETYCVQKSWGCHSPGEKDSLRHPHTDHVHFSFTWDGAKKRTSYWNKKMSLISAGDTSPLASGYWLLGRNGSVASAGLPFLGSKESSSTERRSVALASTPTGAGYWVATKDGRVSAFGDAPHKGGARGDTNRVVDIAPTPTGRGYWILSAMGRPFAFGDAIAKGRPELNDPIAVGMGSSPTGRGYWIVTKTGRVTAFGDAADLGSLDGSGSVRGIVPTPTGQGYWLFTSSGRVAAFGDARKVGDLSGKSLTAPIVAMGRTPSGAGYWLFGAKGKVAAFGDATRFKTAAPFYSVARSRPPAGIDPSLIVGD